MQTLFAWGPGLAVGFLTGLVVAALLPSGRARAVRVRVDDDGRPTKPPSGT